MSTVKNSRRLRIKRGVRNKISGVPERPRLSVFRSNTAIYAQIIDDVNGVTLASVSSQKLSTKGTKTEQALEVGKEIAKLAVAKNINTVVFDRNGYLFHGRIKSLADGAREGGLKF